MKIALVWATQKMDLDLYQRLVIRVSMLVMGVGLDGQCLVLIR